MRVFIETSGWSESNRRLPPPKGGTLTRLSYTPYLQTFARTACQFAQTKPTAADLVEDDRSA